MTKKEASGYLIDQPNEKQFVVVSFFVTNPEALLKLKASWALRNADHSKVLGNASGKAEVTNLEEFGGSIALADPANLKGGLFAEIAVPLAFGLCTSEHDGSLYVASGSVLRQFRGGRCVRTLSHPLFNDLHSLTPSISGNLLVASTGVDTILEVNPASAPLICWDWLATEHGYNATPTGKLRIIDRSLDYQSARIITPDHTTHVNTALNDRPDRVLATLFHQGTLIEIDMLSKRSRVILSNLKSPHSIRRRRDGFMLCDTRANRVLLLDSEFCIKAEIKGDFDWAQDALQLTNPPGYLVADSNNERLVLFDDSGEITSILQWPKGSRKIAAMEVITVAEAKNIFLPA